MMMMNDTLKRAGSGEDDRKAKFLRRLSLVRPIRSPSLIVIPEDEDCFLYNLDERKVHKPEHDVSGFQFLASSGKWLLVVDPRLNLSIIDLFSEKKIDLPPLESLDGATATYILERTKDRDTELREKVFRGLGSGFKLRTAEDLRGLLWVDEGKEELEYAAVWRFDKTSHYIGFCKSGYDHHFGSPTHPGLDRESIRWNLRGLTDMVLQRDSIYIFTDQRCIRILQFSGQDGLKDVSHNLVPYYQPIYKPALSEMKQASKIISKSEKIAVTRSGDVLVVDVLFYEDAASTRHTIFRLSKRDPTLDQNSDCNFAVVDSLGDEALFLDSGIMVPADKTLGIEPNSIYFTRDERVCSQYAGWHPILDICVYNLATKTFKRCPGLSNLKIKDALWFIPS